MEYKPRDGHEVSGDFPRGARNRIRILGFIIGESGRQWGRPAVQSVLVFGPLSERSAR